MLHFIPAWYQQDLWCENEQSWTKRRMHTEFDDTVKQVQLFHRNRFYPYQIMLLSFAPNFRHFLHRQGIFHAPYWSCFDAVQEVRREKSRAFVFPQHEMAAAYRVYLYHVCGFRHAGGEEIRADRIWRRRQSDTDRSV